MTKVNSKSSAITKASESAKQNVEWTTAEIDGILDEYKAVTVPVSISVKGRQKILSFKECQALLRKARNITLEPCWCRLKIKGCDAPVDICVSMNREAALGVSEREGRHATIKEALDALKRGHQAGLVHLAYEDDSHEIQAICSCCSCCCHTLSAITRFGYDPAIVGHSDVVAVHIPSTCTDCGICVDRCHFKAWTKDGEKVAHHPEKCAGCGVCVSFCPSGSIKLVKRVLKKRKMQAAR
jgi:ferredoxin